MRDDNIIVLPPATGGYARVRFKPEDFGVIKNPPPPTVMERAAAAWEWWVKPILLVGFLLAISWTCLMGWR